MLSAMLLQMLVTTCLALQKKLLQPSYKRAEYQIQSQRQIFQYDWAVERYPHVPTSTLFLQCFLPNHLQCYIWRCPYGFKKQCYGRKYLAPVYQGMGPLIAFYQYLQNLPSQCSDDNHGYDTTQEKHYHNGVNDRKPMNLHICHGEINVPTRGPSNIRLFPLYFICEIQSKRTIHF